MYKRQAWLRWVAEGRGDASGDPGRNATRIGSGGPSSGSGGGRGEGAAVIIMQENQAA